jgi:predicted RNA-binding protein Jag
MNVHEFEGKNEEEAISKAIEALGLDREEIDVEIVEAKKSAFLFGGGKVRIRVHLDDDRQAAGAWGPDGEHELRGEPGSEDEDRQPLDYRHPAVWQQPASRRGQRSPNRQGGKPSGQRSRRGSSSSDRRRSREDRSAADRYGADRYGAAEARPARTTFLEPESDFERRMLEFLKGLFEHVGIDANVRIAFREERKLGLDVDSPDSAILIGKRGQTLEAIQTVANVVASRTKNGTIRVIVDSQNYRERRERSLVRMAQQIADEVRKTRQSRLLEAMNPFERRLIHTTLSEEADIETASEGEGLYKRVRILYRGDKGSRTD